MGIERHMVDDTHQLLYQLSLVGQLVGLHLQMVGLRLQMVGLLLSQLIYYEKKRDRGKIRGQNNAKMSRTSFNSLLSF